MKKKNFNKKEKITGNYKNNYFFLKKKQKTKRREKPVFSFLHKFFYLIFFKIIF
jgi:hypothetical protein